MAKNNQTDDKFRELDKILRQQTSPTEKESEEPDVYGYARSMAEIENVIAVVSDLAAHTSRIYNGRFAERFGLEGYTREDSIWETKILSLIPRAEQEIKFIAELRFFHFLRRIGKNRGDYYLMTKLRMSTTGGEMVNVLHRMYYIYDKKLSAIRYAVCLYGPQTAEFNGSSVVVNSVTGVSEELTSSVDHDIISARERQILSLIDSGLKSKEIAERLHISIHTVSRHRQDILEKLQVKNSIEACRVAKQMKMI